MTIKQLLGGVAAAALLGGAASAQIVGTVGGDYGVTVASESGQELSGDLVLTFTLDGEFAGMGAGGEVELLITVNGGTFSAPVGTMSLASTGAGCTFSAAPTLGGGAGGNTVRYESTAQLNQCATGNIEVTLPVVVSENGEPVTVSAEFTGTADVGSYDDQTVNIEADDILEYAPAIEFAIAASADANGELNADGDGFRDGGNLTNGTLGTLGVTVDTALQYDLQNTVADINDLVASADFVVTFPEGVDGLTAIELGGEACTVAGSTATCELGTTELTALEASDLDFIVDLTTTESVADQVPTATLTAVATTDNGPIEGVDSTDLTRLSIDDGLGEFPLTAEFLWTRVGSGGTESNFRLSGPFSAGEIRSVIVSFGDGNRDFPASVTLSETDTPSEGFRISEDVISFTSQGLGVAAGLSGNVDITGITIVADENVFSTDGSLEQLSDATASVSRLLINRNELGLSDL